MLQVIPKPFGYVTLSSSTVLRRTSEKGLEARFFAAGDLPHCLERLSKERTGIRVA
jgi:hypothetical protein